MEHFTNEKKLLVHLGELVCSKHPLRDLKEHTSLLENRRAIRICVKHSVMLTISGHDIEEKSLESHTVNISESGILLNTKVHAAYWEQVEPFIKKANISYKFTELKEMSGDTITGKVTRYKVKEDSGNGEVEVELGVQHIPRDLSGIFGLLQYINNRLIDSVHKDIARLEKEKGKRDLSQDEQDIYEFLITEFTDRG
ncbi:PilZ domain-containing protein [candidate division KSB1 bacterium]